MSKLIEQINKEKREMTLGDVVTFHRGYDLPLNEIKPGSYPVVFSNGRRENHAEFKVTGPGVFTGRSGSLGGIFYVEENYWPHNTTLYVSNFHGNDPKYCYYFLSSFDFAKFNAGTGVPTLNRNHIHGIPVKIPDLPTQKKIAEILSAYDAKIENNNLIIKKLEATAQTLFDEWFINFRFPGYEKVKFVDSEMGEIPEGWEVLKLGDIFDIKYGKNLPTSKISKEGNFPVYGAGGVIGFYEKKNVDEKVILITCRGNGSGTIWRTNGEGFVTNNSFMILPKKNFNYFNFISIYFLFKNSNVSAALSGSAQPQITIDGLSPIQTIFPDRNLLESFQKLTTVMFDLTDELLEENISLRLQRDQLLAKLI